LIKKLQKIKATDRMPESRCDENISQPYDASAGGISPKCRVPVRRRGREKECDKWRYFGEWLDNETFIQVRYSYLYDGLCDYRESRYHGVGTASFSDLFAPDHTIKTPEELKTIGDTVSWCNFGYIYIILLNN